MSYVFEATDDEQQTREFHMAMRSSLLPILAYIEQNQLYQTDEFAMTCRRGFTQIVRWVESQYRIESGRRS